MALKMSCLDLKTLAVFLLLDQHVVRRYKILLVFLFMVVEKFFLTIQEISYNLESC